MNIDLRYQSSFTYDAPVADSQNLLRACPATNEYQRLISYRVEVDPPSSLTSYIDYWGTRVDAFGINKLHTRLSVVATASVQTLPHPEPPPTPLPSPNGEWNEFGVPSPHVQWNEPIAAMAQRAVEGLDTAPEAALAIHRAVGSHMTYVPGVTEVGVPVDEVFTSAAGVCQDYAHLALALYRSVGFSARYVSGYLYSADSADGGAPEADEIDVKTHAWVEVEIPGWGWWALDPTNQLEAGERHVKIGHGRDYEDVTPLRGVFHGTGSQAGLDVSVKMTTGRLAHHSFSPQPDLETLKRSHQQ